MVEGQTSCGEKVSPYIMILFTHKPSQIYLDAGFIGLMGAVPLFVYA